MLVSVAAETRPGERRVALTPEAVSLLVGQGHDVRVKAGAGLAALAADEDYGAAGADVRSGDVLEGADRWRTSGRCSRLRWPGCALARSPSGSSPVRRAGRHWRPAGGRGHRAGHGAASRGSRGPSRWTRCLPGARRRLPVRAGGGDAAAAVLPLFMTAAGTVPPAKVLVLGAGVAGLQAIATARRLGAVVEAYDVRPPRPTR